VKKHSFLMISALPAIVAVAGFSCIAPEGTETARLGPSEAIPASPLEAAYVDVIDALLSGMGHKELIERRESQLAFEKICFLASGPGRETRRRVLSKAIMMRVGPEIAKPARVWLLRKIEPIGRCEVVKPLTTLLHDEDAQIRELARRALQNNPSPKAAAVLRAELAAAECDAWRVALINALAFRRDTASTSAFSELARSDKDAVAAAAIAALGKIGTRNAVRTLTELRESVRPALRDEVTDARLRSAEALLTRGDKARSASLYEQLSGSSETETVRIAALHGLAAARGVNALPRLLGLITGDDERMQIVALRCAQGIPGEEVTRRLAAALDDAAPDIQVLLLDVLGQRGDAAALPKAVALLQHSDRDVRMAALQALKHLGNSSTVLVLAKWATKTTEDEQDAARDSLALLRGPDVDKVILSAMEGANAPVRAELIQAAAERRIDQVIPVLYAAADEPEELVRVAALDALGKLGAGVDLPKLLGLLVKAQSNRTRQASEKAVTAVCLRIDDKLRRAAPVIAALSRANPPAKASVIRVLGKIEGDDALTAVLEHRKAKNKTVKGAAVRALAKWTTPGALAGLLDIAKTSDNEAHQELALRGYVRLVRLPSEREPAATFEMLRDVMGLAKSAEDKKLILVALKEVGHLDALNFVLPYLDDEALRAEAADAALGLAVGVSGQHQAEAIAALKRVRKMAPTDAMKDQADKALDVLKRYCVTWLFSAPYKEKGKNREQLMDVAFAPEDPKAKAVWKPLPVTNAEHPGRLAFDKISSEHDCCGYAKTAIWSEKQQEALLTLGSDDGIKAWLNGTAVHTNNAARGIVCDEDKVTITLKKGWNPLLLKVTQGGGGWGFCCAIKAPDGTLLEGLMFEAK